MLIFVYTKHMRVYLDYAASTPVDPRVFEAMKPYFSEKFGNAGSLHSYGQEAMGAVDRAREIVAKAIGARFEEIIFTSSATEANNLALRGVLSALMQNDKIQDLNDKSSSKSKTPSNLSFGFSHRGFKPRIIISSIEHESIHETARELESKGIEVVHVPVNKEGIIDLKRFERELTKKTFLVSIMYANNETGMIQPIAEIAKIIRQFKEKSKTQNLNDKSRSKTKGQNALSLGFSHLGLQKGPLLHVDAVQAFNYLDCRVNELHVDMMTLSSHKIYGPKGAGCLYVRDNEKKVLIPILTGGGQEFGLRSSTENVPAIVGFGRAAELVSNSRELENRRLSDLRNYLWTGLRKIYRKAVMNGSMNRRLPNNINFYVPGIKAEEMLIRLDLAGIAASSGSACKSRALDKSHVLSAMGYNADRSKNSIRLTLGRETTKADINYFLKKIAAK